MKYSVIHSNDPYLLARMATDLQMSGLHNERLFDFLAFDNWIAIHGKFFYYINHDGVANPTRHELTESNYLQVLEAVLS